MSEWVIAGISPIIIGIGWLTYNRPKLGRKLSYLFLVMGVVVSLVILAYSTGINEEYKRLFKENSNISRNPTEWGNTAFIVLISTAVGYGILLWIYSIAPSKKKKN